MQNYLIADVAQRSPEYSELADINTDVFRCSSVQVFKCSGVQVFMFSGVRVFMCSCYASEQMKPQLRFNRYFT